MLTQQLKTAADNPVHCYIFAGPPSSGKTDAAYILAQSLVRHDELEQTHNIVTLCAEAEGKMIKISQVREMIATLALKPLEDEQRRVVIIKSAHNMTAEGVNALLKILEEPPEGVVFILISSRLASLLPTIRSRAQIIRFFLNNEQTGDISAGPRAEHFLKANVVERFILSKEIHDRKDGKMFLSALYDVLSGRSDRFEYAPLLLKIERALDHNVNSRLLYEWLALEINL